MKKNYLFLLIAFMGLINNTAFSQNSIWTWKNLAEPGGNLIARADAGTVAINNKLYILGGYTSCGPKDFTSYDLTTGKIKKLAPLGYGCANPIYYGCLFNVGAKIYSFSGNGYGIYDTLTDSWSTGNLPTSGNILPDCGFVINDTIFLVSQTGNYFYSFNTVTNTFRQRANTICTPNRTTGIAFSINGKGYFGAGITANSWYNDFYQYDPVLDTWTTKASLPINLYKGVGASDNNKGYAGLGLTLSGTNSVLTSNWYEYNPLTNLWSVKQSANYLVQDQSACYYNGKVYLFGGQFGYSGAPYRDDIRAYNIASNTWSTINDDPGTNRTESSGFYSNGKIYIAGGQDDEPLNDMREYNIANNTWTKKANSHSYYAQRACCELGGNGYFIGGYNKSNSSNYYSDSLIKYNPSTDTWSNISQYPGGKRGNMIMVSYNGNIFAGMGTNTLGQNVTDFKSYNLTTNTWSNLTSPTFAYAEGISKSYFVINDTLYLYTSSGYSAHLYKYSFLANTWSVSNLPSFTHQRGSYNTNEGYSFNGKGYFVIEEMGQEEIAEYDPTTGSCTVISTTGFLSRSQTIIAVPNDGVYFGFGVDERDMGELGVNKSNHWRKFSYGNPSISNQVGTFSLKITNTINAITCGSGVLPQGTTASMIDTLGNLFYTINANSATQYYTCITYYSKDTLLPYATACAGFGYAYNSTTENGMFLNKSFIPNYNFFLSGGNILRLYYTSRELKKFLAAFNSKYNLNYTIDSMKLIGVGYPSVIPDDNPLNNGGAPVTTYKINWQNYGTDKYFDIVASNLVSISHAEYYIALSARAYRKVTTTVCDSLVFKNHTYYTSGNYTLNVPNAIGCDSTFDINLTIKNSTIKNIYQTSCVSYKLNSTTYTASGNYIQHLTNAKGCDSTINLYLTINPKSFKTINQSICNGDSVYFNNHYLKNTGLYKDTLVNYRFCDSIISLNLLVKPLSTKIITTSICAGSSYSVGANNYNTTGTFITHLTNYRGCDSTVTLHLTVKSNSTNSLSASICQGTSYTVGTTNYNTAGTYITHLTNYLGCDSAVTLNLTILPNSTKNITASICQGSNYTVGTTNYNATGTFTTHLTNYLGCDSAVILNLTVLSNSTKSITTSICQGSNYTIGTTNYNTAGTYVNHLTNYLGCDSAVTLNLTVLSNSTKSITTSICNGNSYTIGTSNYNTTGTFINHFTNYLGCDSTVTLNLTVKATSSKSITQSICNGNSINFNGQVINTTGFYKDTLINYLGCDSFLTLHLIVNTPSSKSLNQSICIGSNIIFNGQTIYSSGIYKDTLINYLGCDSIITLQLSVNPSPGAPTVSIAGCDMICDTIATNYQWNLGGNPISGATLQTYTAVQKGFYSVKISNSFGCSKTSANNYLSCATGVSELVDEKFVKLYPNPTSSVLNINFSEKISKGLISFYNMEGKLLIANKLYNTDIHQLDISKFSNGLYIIAIQVDDKPQSYFKIIKSDF